MVGLDTMAHVIKTLQDNLSLETDPFYGSFGTPAVLAKLIELGHLGQKTKAGFFKKVGRDILRFELDSEDYVARWPKADEVYARMLEEARGRAPADCCAMPKARLASSCGPFCATASTTPRCTWSTIAESARDVDQAMRWGFGMKQGPFELWQEAGWLQVAKMVQEDIDAGKALCNGAPARLGV